MNRFTPSVRNPRELNRDRRAALQIARGSWASLSAPHAGRPTAISEAVLAECRCPTDCIRDHEND